jgi:hypothetical protein
MDYKRNITDKDLEGLSDEEKGELIANSDSLTTSYWIPREEYIRWRQANKEWDEEIIRRLLWGNGQGISSANTDEEYELIPCTCLCHSNPGERHIVACCQNGYKRIKKTK